jgi:hypothetical protein
MDIHSLNALASRKIGVKVVKTAFNRLVEVFYWACLLLTAVLLISATYYVSFSGNVEDEMFIIPLIALGGWAFRYIVTGNKSWKPSSL